MGGVLGNSCTGNADDTSMLRNADYDRKEEAMLCANEDQQGYDTTGSLSASHYKAQGQTSHNQLPRPLPKPRFNGGSGHSHANMANVHRDPGTKLQTQHNQESNSAIQIQDQMTVELHRSLQASKQMAYQVFANVITAIEELEHRESKTKKGVPAPERSNAFIPDQSFKNDQDVVAGVEAQLVVFQSHMSFSPKEISEQIKVEMLDTTLTWAAARHDINLPLSKVDQYAVNLLEILYVGATKETFSILKKSWRLLSRSELMSNFSKILQGQAEGMQLEKQFIENPAKEAEALPIRQGTNIADGILRLIETATKLKKPKLVKLLELHLESIGCAR